MSKFRLKFEDFGGGRGLTLAKFIDSYGVKCSLQDSSSAEDDYVWLGCDEGTHHHLTLECSARMHLNREQAGELAKHLKRFARTGRLPKPRRARSKGIGPAP